MVKVWSPVVRLSHWLLVIAFFTAFYTRDSEWTRHIHVYAGYSAGGILLGRIFWGFVAQGYENFSAFPPDIPQAIRYVASIFAGHAKRYMGHNPAGSLVIYAMLAIGLLTTASGIAVYNDAYLPFSSSTLQELHEYPAWAWALLVAAHISGVMFESFLHRENLIATMISGYKKSDGE